MRVTIRSRHGDSRAGSVYSAEELARAKLILRRCYVDRSPIPDTAAEVGLPEKMVRQIQVGKSMGSVRGALIAELRAEGLEVNTQRKPLRRMTDGSLREVCSESDCNAQAAARGYCSRHG